jgi:hypothetical protein
MTQLIWDIEYTRNELDRHWTTSRLADEFFLCLCLNKKYYQQDIRNHFDYKKEDHE